jgi:hypothetical protein
MDLSQLIGTIHALLTLLLIMFFARNNSIKQDNTKELKSFNKNFSKFRIDEFKKPLSDLERKVNNIVIKLKKDK